MNGAIAGPFLQRRWRCFRYEHGSAYLLDAAAGYLSRAPSSVIASASPPAPGTAASLAQVSAAWARNQLPAPCPESDGELRLSLLGGRILVRFRHQQCRDDVSRYFSCSHDVTEASPDVIVECDWPTADRYLFRARPAQDDGTPLDGVRVQAFGDAAPSVWTSAQPPLPPLPVAPFRDRYAALHAATLRTPDGRGITIAGERSSGKSTCALLLGRRTGFEFLADETTFVHLRTAIAEPFPQSVGVWHPDGRKEPVPASQLFRRVATRPVLIEQIVILERSTGTSRIEQMNPSQTFRALLPHHRDASAGLDEAMVTLDHIARQATAIRLHLCCGSDLVRLLNDIA